MAPKNEIKRKEQRIPKIGVRHKSTSEEKRRKHQHRATLPLCQHCALAALNSFQPYLC